MEDHLAYLIASINRQLEEELTEALKPKGIAIEQFRILAALSSSDGRSMGDLAGVVLVDPASLTKIVDKMIAEAFVYRAPDPDDRRRVRIFLASKGRALYRKLEKLHDVQQANLTRRLSGKGVEEFSEMLRGLLRP